MATFCAPKAMTSPLGAEATPKNQSLSPVRPSNSSLRDSQPAQGTATSQTLSPLEELLVEPPPADAESEDSAALVRLGADAVELSADCPPVVLKGIGTLAGAGPQPMLMTRKAVLLRTGRS